MVETSHDLSRVWTVCDCAWSPGEYCCGPCPVAAIKEGNLGLKYDARFVFAEVNADIVHWISYGDGRRQKVTTGSPPPPSEGQTRSKSSELLFTGQGGPEERGEEHQHKELVWKLQRRRDLALQVP